MSILLPAPDLIRAASTRLRALAQEAWNPDEDACWPDPAAEVIRWVHHHHLAVFPPDVQTLQLTADLNRHPERLTGACLDDLRYLLGFILSADRQSPGALASFMCSPRLERWCARLDQVAEAGGKPSALDRQRGCLMGLFVGDALGAQVEFMGPKGIAEAFPNGVRTMAPGGPHRLAAGQLTDDGELAITVMGAVDIWGTYDAERAAQGYADWLDSKPFDIGGTIAAAICGGMEARIELLAKRAARRAAQGLPPHAPENRCIDNLIRSPDDSLAANMRAAASHDSQANGALMRLGGLVARGFRGDVITTAAADARLTHPHPVCVSANRAMAAAMQTAIVGITDAVGVWTAAMEAAHDPADPPDAAVIVRRTLTDALTAPPDRCHGDKAGWVLKALQLAFWHLRRGSTFEDALVDIVGRGGDSDTNAAIGGMLLGAYHGASAIPASWVATVHNCRPDDDSPQPRPQRWWAATALDALRFVPESRG